MAFNLGTWKLIFKFSTKYNSLKKCLILNSSLWHFTSLLEKIKKILFEKMRFKNLVK